MKGRKLTQTIMLVFVLAVWGLIIYKVYSKFNDNGEEEVAYNVPDDKITGSPIADTFQLLANYNDPFTNQAAVRSSEEHHEVKNTSQQAARPVIKAVTPPAAPVQVRYLGMIRNNNSKKKVALISVNSKSSLLQENESVDDVKLLKLFRDSVLVQIGKQKLYIRNNH